MKVTIVRACVPLTHVPRVWPIRALGFWRQVLVITALCALTLATAARADTLLLDQPSGWGVDWGILRVDTSSPPVTPTMDPWGLWLSPFVSPANLDHQAGYSKSMTFGPDGNLYVGRLA